MNKKNYDYIIIGNGITGNFLAYHLLKLNTQFKIKILFDPKINPASTRNAGFFTMGSFVFLHKIYSQNKALYQVVRENVEHVKTLGMDLNCMINQQGSYTILHHDLNQSEKKFLDSIDHLKEKSWLKFKYGVFNSLDFSCEPNHFLQKLRDYNISHGVEYIQQNVSASSKKKLKASKIIVATNGGGLIEPSVNQIITPQRAQIQKIKLPHSLGVSANIYDPKNRVYLRWEQDQLIIGGLRSLDIIREQTGQEEVNEKIQLALKKYAQKFFLTNFDFKPDELKLLDQWSGIMGFTQDELPKVIQLKKNGYFIGGFSGHGNGFSFWLSQQLINLFERPKSLSPHFQLFSII